MNVRHPRVSYIHFLSKIFFMIKWTILFSCDDVCVSVSIYVYVRRGLSNVKNGFGWALKLIFQ